MHLQNVIVCQLTFQLQDKCLRELPLEVHCIHYNQYVHLKKNIKLKKNFYQ